mgnify:CR=1 FL=1
MNQSPERQPSPEPSAQACVTRRGILTGLLLVPLNVYWVLAAELRWYVVLTLNPLFVTPVFYLFVLAGLNSLFRRWSPRLAFTRADLVVIYVMLVMSCTVATHDFIINLMSTVGWASWYATPENRWEDLMFPHLPKWLFVWDRDVMEGAFYGNRPLTDPQVLRAWVPPLLFWSVFILSIGWMMLCLSVIVRRAWMDETKLSFPIVRLPLELTQSDAPGSIVRSKALRAGFLLAAGLALLNGLHVWYPNLPHLQVRARFFQFPTPPWWAAPVWIAWYPFGIGLAYLVPLDISFSCWFFFLFYRAQSVAGYAAGYGSIPDFPFVHEQGMGAWFAFGVSLLVVYRRYLLRIFRSAAGLEKVDDSGEPMSYRLAVLGLLAGMVVFGSFWLLAGMSLIWVLVVLLVYLLVSLSITRVRAEAGGQHNAWDLEPMNLMRLLDSHLLGPANLAMAAASHWYWRLNRSHPMPSQFEAFKLAQENGMKLKSLTLPMLAAFALATFVGMWACLDIFYRDGISRCYGFAVWTGIEAYGWLSNALDPGFRAEPARWAVVGGAAGFTALLAALRARFPWFPFHPLGYCMASEMRWLWFPFFIAWALKLVVLHAGGLKLYRQTLPFFLGLVLGDYVMGAIWSLIGVVFHVPVHQIFH